MTTIKQPEQLCEKGFIAKDKIDKLKTVTERFSLSITEQMTDLIDPCQANDPIAKQFIPNEKELLIHKNELSDPIGDNTHSPVKGIIHRYPDRCLLLPMTTCPVYCRFCFRREKVGSPQSGLNKRQLDEAFKYIENNPQIWEVILSGGDPLFMSPKMMKLIISRLSNIPHIEVLRIHTRVPVVDSDRISQEMLNSLKSNKALYVVLHANHKKEFTDKAKVAIAKIVDAGIPMIGQTVLLKGINDDPQNLKELLREFVKNRVKPYYLHHGDFAKGTSHFRTTIEEGQLLMKQIRGNLSGLCQPNYTLDIPGGFGKIPINPNYITDSGNHYIAEDYEGNKHQYPKENLQ